jgi:hypothetical protein
MANDDIADAGQDKAMMPEANPSPGSGLACHRQIPLTNPNPVLQIDIPGDAKNDDPWLIGLLKSFP